MALDRVDITDGRGRRAFLVERRKLAAKAVEEAPGPTYVMPRTWREWGDRLDRLVYLMRRLSPDAHNPDRYFELRSEIERDLARLAQWAHRQKD